ncbi:MAG: hypothetical protein AAF927_31015 [Bacteroidota bacterium]
MKYLYIFFTLWGTLSLLACGEEAKQETIEEEVPAVREQLQILRLRAGAYPQSVKPGEVTEIDLLVTDATGKPVSNVNVEVDVADGVFTATGNTVIVGPTNGRGEFRTEWQAPNPSLSGYKLSFRAKIDGVAEGREELLILVD